MFAWVIMNRQVASALRKAPPGQANKVLAALSRASNIADVNKVLRLVDNKKATRRHKTFSRRLVSYYYYPSTRNALFG